MNYKFVNDQGCEWFPCHQGIKNDKFNCRLCFCPLHPFDNCGGNYIILENEVKDCSNCLIPHSGEKGYDYIVNKLEELMY